MSKIALIFDKTFPDTLGVYVKRALDELNIAYDHICSSQMEAISTGYDLYFRVIDGYPERLLPARCHPAIYWTSDAHVSGTLRHLKKQVGNYDLVFAVLQSTVEKLKPYSKKVFFVSVACDPNIHRKIDQPKKYDIGYVGTDGGNPRKFILQSLKERYKNSYIGRAPYIKISEIYSQSKIGFSYPICLEGLTMRSFEIAACGTFQIMPRLPKTWAEELGFEDGKHLMMYESTEHLLKLLDYYLAHEEEREKIASASYALVLQKHTYKHKVCEILRGVQQELNILKDLQFS